MPSLDPPQSHRGLFEKSVYWSMVIIAGVGFLLVPALASGAGEEVITLFRGDFDSGDNPWWHTKGQGTADVRDGYLFSI